MTDPENDKGALNEWYQRFVRPFFLQTDPARAAECDAEAARLARPGAPPESLGALPVCFLGNSGIGKSTLINAIVAGSEMILPSGGIGPLTAQALTVCHGQEAAFEVLYHAPAALNRAIFGLDRHYLAQRRKEGKSTLPPVSPEAMGLRIEGEPPEALADLETAGAPEEELSERERRIEYLKKQALLMVAGSQDAERPLPYLIDALRAVYGLQPAHGYPLLEEDKPRVETLARALQAGKSQSRRRFAESDTPEFRRRLYEHATGFLAPLIKDLRLRWNSPVLAEGLVLIDLPGVGIAGDVHSGVTETFIREKARAIVLVVSSRGVPEKEAELLRNSGFLNRLLHAGDDPAADPLELLVVVVRTDDLSRARFAGDKSRRRIEHFSDICQESAVRLRAQLRVELEKVWAASDGLTLSKRAVLDALVERMQVHALSAVQYQLFLAADPEEPAFIKEAVQSRVPQFIAALGELVVRRRAALSGQAAEAERLFLARLNSRLELSRAQWIEERRAGEQAGRLAAALKEFLAPLTQEWSVRQGMLREFLKSTLPVLICGLVQAAGARARKEVLAYLRTLESAHWRTLQAAVRRGGTYHGSRLIQLPHDFALRFEEPIAEVWGRQLLCEIRTRTGQYAEDCVRLVEQLLAWAKNHGANFNTAVLEAQLEVIKGDAQRLNAVGREAVDELREHIKNSLIRHLEPPIRIRCERFVEHHQDRGAGVRRRILDLFAELADEVIEAASEPAIALLTRRFREVEAEILRIFEEHPEPLATAAGAIVSSHQERERLGNSRRRTEVLAQLDVIEAARPGAKPALPAVA